MYFGRKGRRAKAIDDRSGFKVNYKDLKTEWNGRRVVRAEFETKHPALTPPVIDGREAEPLANPRLDNDDDSGVADWHLLTGPGLPVSNNTTDSTQIEDLGRWDMTFGAKT